MHYIKALGLVLLVLALLTGIGFGLGVFQLGVAKPVYLNLETKAQRQSNSYVDAKVNALLGTYATYQKLETEIADGLSAEPRRAQQAALVKLMCDDANKIDHEWWPSGVASLLRAKCG